jgi:glycosyltransferase EpsD
VVQEKMMKKILFTASIAKHILRFHLPYLKWFQDHGYITHVACYGHEKIPYVYEQFQISFSRKPYSISNFGAYKSLKELIDKNEYILIHCHTPVVSVLTRLAAKNARSKGTKVLYTAHGFHFFKGASFFNWIAYYPIELLLRSNTDAIITINSEDYESICDDNNPKLKVYKIPGIGVDKRRFVSVNIQYKEKLRFKNGYNSDEFILIYAAELISRKNHIFLIKAIDILKNKIPNIKLIFAGRGVLQTTIEEKIKNKGLNKYIAVLGFRDDIADLYSLSDICVSSSKQEGLGLNLIEAMFCGLPVVATQDRGHNEVVIHGENGFLFPQNEIKMFVYLIEKLYYDTELRNKISAKSILTSSKFELTNSQNEMEKIYSLYLDSKLIIN